MQYEKVLFCICIKTDVKSLIFENQKIFYPKLIY